MSTHQLSPVARAAEAATQSELDRLLQRPFTPRDLLEEQNFDKIWRMAEALSGSALSIPKELKGNIGDCLAIVTQAMIWGLNPFAVAQKAHVINGKLGYEAQLVNAVVMASGAIHGSFFYEYNGSGNDIECRVGARLAGDSQVTWGEWLSASSVVVKNSPLWKTNVKQQMGYLQVKNFARAYCPGALLGIYTVDELADEDPLAMVDAPPAPRGPQRRSETQAPPAAATTQAPPPAAKTQAPPAAASAGVPDRITAGQVAYLRNKIKAAGMAESSACARYEVGSIEEFKLDAFDELRSELLAMS